MTQGKWSPTEACLHIKLQTQSRQEHVCSLSFAHQMYIFKGHDRQDNMQVLHKSSGGHRIILLLCRSTKTLELVHFPQHISGLPTRSAEHDSRQFQPQVSIQSWVGDELSSISPHIQIVETPTIDLFTTFLNKKCPRYRSRSVIRQHSLGDALLLSWDKGLLPISSIAVKNKK